MVPGRWRGGHATYVLDRPGSGLGRQCRLVRLHQRYPTGSRQLCGRWGCNLQGRQLSVDRGVRAGLLQGGVGSRWTLCKSKARYPRAVLPCPFLVNGKLEMGLMNG